MGRKESKKRINRVKRMKDIKNKKERERERENFFSFLGMHVIGDGKLFYRFSKWLSLMNINGSHIQY